MLPPMMPARSAEPHLELESRTLNIRLVYKSSKISLALRLSSRNITRKLVTVLALLGVFRTSSPSWFGDFMSLIHKFMP